jgi:hypothetical protein
MSDNTGMNKACSWPDAPMGVITHPELGYVHPDSPRIGDIVKCINPARNLHDKAGFKVENLGWSKGTGVPFGYFTARSSAGYGALYQMKVDEWAPIKSLVHTGGLGYAHPDSPKPGDVVRCTNLRFRMNDPFGYLVEDIGYSNCKATGYGHFNVRGRSTNKLYTISVSDYATFGSIWQCIESSPRDGKRFTVGMKGSPVIASARCVGGGIIIDAEMPPGWQPTHWMDALPEIH